MCFVTLFQEIGSTQCAPLLSHVNKMTLVGLSVKRQHQLKLHCISHDEGKARPNPSNQESPHACLGARYHIPILNTSEMSHLSARKTG